MNDDTPKYLLLSHWVAWRSPTRARNVIANNLTIRYVRNRNAYHTRADRVAMRRCGKDVAALLKEGKLYLAWRNCVNVRLPFEGLREQFEKHPDRTHPNWLYKVRNLDYYEDPRVESVHVSAVNPEMLAFAESYERWAQDRFVRTTPGRWLKKVLPDISDKDAQMFSRMHVEQYGNLGTDAVRWAKTGDEIAHVLAKGPSESCMSDSHHNDNEGWYAGPEHPGVVYGTGDVWAAYLRVGDRITARCLVNVHKKLASRCYGDCSRLMPLLADLGYEQKAGALIGCRLVKIEADGGYVMPYVDRGMKGGDGALSVVDHGDYFRLVGGDGDLCCDSTRGVCEAPDMCSCEDCGDRHHEDDMTYVENHGQICESCINDNYVEARNRRGYDHWVHSDDATYCEDNETYYLSHDIPHIDSIVFDTNGELRDIDCVTYCEEEGDYYDSEDVVELAESCCEFAPRDACVETPEGWVRRSLYSGDTSANLELPLASAA